MDKNVLIIPDTHHPWADQAGLGKMNEWLEEYGEHLDLVIHIGDALDQYNWSRFDKSIDLMTPEDELTNGMNDYRLMWESCKELAPNAKYVQMLGNHDVRFIKMAEAKVPSIVTLLNKVDIFKEVYSVEGVRIIRDPREIFRFDGVAYHHGDFLRSMVPGKRAGFLGESIVFGHTHRQWLVPVASAGGIFELNVGSLGDENSKPMQYTPVKHPWQNLGWGYILNGQPGLVTL